MSFALLFSGQGAQHPDMLPWLQRDETVAAVERRLGPDWRERLADPMWAGDNARAQYLLTALSLAAYRQLTTEIGPPAVVVGYSVGELAAFSAAGVFGVTAALQLAESRAASMDAAAASVRTGLMGVNGGAPADLRHLCERFDLDVAIRIGSVSAIVGGPAAVLDSAAESARHAGLNVTRLNVALASHTRWMRPALPSFAAALNEVSMTRPTLHLTSCSLGRIHSAEHARNALLRQIAETVRWDECLDWVHSQRVDAVLEIGPGHALARMWNERYPGVPARSADEFRKRSSLTAWVARSQEGL